MPCTSVPGRSSPIYDLALAVERVTAAVEAARGLAFPFTLTARAENYLHGRPDLDDTVRRLQAFERAGADVLFAPGLPDLAAVRTVCSAVKKPVNFMVGIRGRSFSVAELAAAGVRRISLSTSLYRAAITGLYAAGREVYDSGTFGYLETIMSGKDLAAPQRAGSVSAGTVSPGAACRAHSRKCAAPAAPSAGAQSANSEAVAGS